MILTIRTDKTEAEIGLFQGVNELAYKKWQAHRELGATIHKAVKELLDSQGKDWNDLEGIVYYKGPGSFTGLRIGAALANALAYGNSIPISSQHGENWISEGIKALKRGKNKVALPEYGSDAFTTRPKK